MSRHLSDLCRENAARAGDRPAVIDHGDTLTHAQLDAEVDRYAAALHGIGVRRDSTVAIWCTNRAEFLCAAIATARLGAVVAAFPTFAKSWDLDYLLEHSRAEVLMMLGGFRGVDHLATVRELLPEIDAAGWRSSRYPSLREVVLIDGAPAPAGMRRLGDLLAAVPEAVRPAEHTSATDDAVIVYTSGSTARPKAVPLQHFGVIENGFSIGERMRLTRDDRVWLAAPLFWSYGFANAMPATLTHAGCLVLQEAFEAGEALELIERHAATAIYTMPAMTHSLLRHESFSAQRTASLRTGLTLGSASDVRSVALELGAAEICNIYGSTETYGNCCVTPSEWPLERRAECQGTPLPGFAFELRDPGTGSPVEEGAAGELYVRGYVTRGYRDGGEANAVFGSDGWYRTGDLGTIGADGAFRFGARASEMIKTNGINVAPGEVEDFLRLHKKISQVAVTGSPDPERGEVVVAFVVVKPGVHLEEGELRAWCRERIAGYKVPARWHLVNELPKTGTGKLSRKQLRELDHDRQLA